MCFWRFTGTLLALFWHFTGTLLAIHWHFTVKVSGVKGLGGKNQEIKKQVGFPSWARGGFEICIGKKVGWSTK